MKQSLWNRFKSYFVDVHLESTSSVYNEQLDVLLVKGEYQLVTPEAIYSYGSKYDNFFEAFKAVPIANEKIDSALILGLGLGSIPYMLENHFDQKYTYTAVEIDEDIVYLASKYVLDELESEVTTICTDALHFIQVDQSTYDFIAMDVFISDAIPSDFESEEYLRSLKVRLNEGGLLFFNRLYFFEHDKKKTEEYYEEVFIKVFPDGRCFHVNGNWILMNR